MVASCCRTLTGAIGALSAHLLWQALGAGELATVLPAALVALQRKARNGALAQSPARGG